MIWALLAACTPLQVLEESAEAATAIGGSRPWTVVHLTVASTTDWDVYEAPSWASICMVKNEHASGVLAVGRYDETSTADLSDPTDDEFLLLSPGAAWTFPVASGSQSHPELPLASTTASLPVGIFCTSSAE